MLSGKGYLIERTGIGTMVLGYWLIVAGGLLAVLYGVVTAFSVMQSDAGTPRMQQIAAVRGAITGLMAEVIEDHIRVHVANPSPEAQAEREEHTEELVEIFRAYLR